MNKVFFYPRFIQERMHEALADSPVVLIHGPRQCGKNTLARKIGDLEGYVCHTFDDDVFRAAASAGVVLYDGETTASFGGRLFVVPIRTLWEER
jgi:predicted AAA+ superfamily ATPase